MVRDRANKSVWLRGVFLWSAVPFSGLQKLSLVNRTGLANEFISKIKVFSSPDASWNCDGSRGENGVSPIHLNNQTTLTTFGTHHPGHTVHSVSLGQGDNSSDDRSSPPNHMKNGYLNSSQVVSSSSHYQSNNIIHQSQTNLTTFSSSSSTVNNTLTSSMSSHQQDMVDRSKSVHSYSMSNAGKTKIKFSKIHDQILALCHQHPLNTQKDEAFIHIVIFYFVNTKQMFLGA